LVNKPYVQDAAVFSADMAIFSADIEIEEVNDMDELATMSQEEISTLKAEAEAGKQAAQELRALKIDATIAEFKAQGKIVPAAEDAARAILLAQTDDLIVFGGDHISVADAFRKFLDAMPKVVEFSSKAQDGDIEDTDSAAIEFAEKYLNIPRETMLKYRDR
jgi:hypothetical protein